MTLVPSCIVALFILSTTSMAFAPPTPTTASLASSNAATERRRSTTKPSAARSRGPTTTIAEDEMTIDDDELLGRPARPGRPLKVAIAGGGVGGLAAALCMLKRGMDVAVYERTAAFARFGGPIQFASNALSVVREIDDVLFDRVMERFTFTGARTCGIKDGLRADGTFRVTYDSLDYLWNANAPADWFVKFPLKRCADVFGLPYTGVIDRPDLQEILIDECRKIKPDFIHHGNPVNGYISRGKGLGVTVNLEDGTCAEADVLVGSDGIWSSVRAQMYGEEIKKSTNNGQKRQGCKYSGYTVFAGETVFKTDDYYDTGYKVYIGPKRYFVTSDVGDGRIQWYAFFALPPGTKKAPSGWGGSERSDQADPEENLVEYIKSLHEGWSDEVMQVLDATPPDSVEQRDLYDRAPELLRSWADGNVVCIGDAVHPMMPNLGQGGCQAIEDAFILSETLEACKSTTKIESALQDFYKKRIVRVTIIQLMSRLASDLIINAFDTPWSPHDNLGKSWKSYLTFFWKPLLQYAIFPAQFAYLYSYHPTGSMGGLPAALEAKWKKQHVVGAEAAFIRVSEDGQQIAAPSFFKIAEQQKSQPATVMAAKRK